MKARLDQLRDQARGLEPSREIREAWNQSVQNRAQDILDALASGPAFCPEADEGKGIEAWGPGEEPQEIDVLLRVLAEHVERPGLKLGSPGFLGFIPISTVYPAALGDYLAAVTNPFSGNYFAAPGAVRLEHQLTRWMAQLIGYPEGAAGDLTSGGSMANLSAIVAAREHKRLGPRDYERAVLYVTGQTHHSIGKALRIAGMERCVRREVPLDESYRLRTDLLQEAITTDTEQGLLPWLIVASAGSTDTGAIDPLDCAAELARKSGIWLHVDGAYGAMFALCEPGKAALAGIEKADSVTLDPHKGLFMPCGSGALLVRDGHRLHQAYRYDAHYMQDRPALASLAEISPSELSPELTRPFRGLRLWLALKLIGVRAFRAALEEKMLLARYFYEAMRRRPEAELGPEPSLSIVVFRYVPRGRRHTETEIDEFNRRLLHAVQRDGRVFLTSTTLNGQFWLRLAVLCNTTHQEHIDLALRVLEEKMAVIQGT